MVLDQIRRRAPERLQTWAVWFWGLWFVIGLVVELVAAFGWGRKHEGDTFSELWWALIIEVKDHGARPTTRLGKGIAYGLLAGAGGFFAWVAVHLSTGWV